MSARSDSDSDRESDAVRLLPRTPCKRRYWDAEGQVQGWDEHFISSEASTSTIAEAVACSTSVLLFKTLATPAECEQLAAEAAAIAEREPGEFTGGCRGTLSARTRLHVPVRLSAAGQALCDALLLRALALLDAQLPGLLPSLFGSALVGAETCMRNAELTFSTEEPAINVYTDGGAFRKHADKQSLTILVPLSEPASEFTGGGTAFWADVDRDSNRARHEDSDDDEEKESPPVLLVAPPAGSAIVFGGELTHAGQPVASGKRCILVASFSPAGAPYTPYRRK